MKYKPNNKDELKQLISIKTIRLDDIDTSLITDMSELFMESKMIDCMGFEVFKSSARKDFSGIDSWDVSKVKSMAYMFAEVKNFKQKPKWYK